MLNQAGQAVPPPDNYEFGISLNRLVAPNYAQRSHIFEGLAEGSYYIFYRVQGTNWSPQQVLKETVTIPVNNQTNNSSLSYRIDGDSVLLMTDSGQEICSKLLRHSLLVNRHGQNEFDIPTGVNVRGITALIINAERYYEGSYILLHNKSKIIWDNDLFALESTDYVAIEYIVSQLI
ncbi:hypothetical protein VB796_06505 [Arcicella sp. LKC2W]|uniref:hypothetical protein n=1 Tax=Arcicella sp. LKC2W TaxID=2984198 RepID=UPI002B1FBFE7|nr:hypothetical protein [Arcicella sp. LKC2W]MEA5458678.1 hypothetical protein [Arcicella sp. LKC2W]